jgi:hypothetical protein
MNDQLGKLTHIQAKEIKLFIEKQAMHQFFGFTISTDVTR